MTEPTPDSQSAGTSPLVEGQWSDCAPAEFFRELCSADKLTRVVQWSVGAGWISMALILAGLLIALLWNSPLSVGTVLIVSSVAAVLLLIAGWGSEVAAAWIARRREGIEAELERQRAENARQKELSDRHGEIVDEVRKAASLDSAFFVLMRYLVPAVRFGYVGVYSVQNGEAQLRGWRGLRKPGARPEIDARMLLRLSKSDIVRIDAETVRRSPFGRSLRGNGLAALLLFRLSDANERYDLIAYSQPLLDPLFLDEEDRTRWLSALFKDVLPFIRELHEESVLTSEAERRRFLEKLHADCNGHAYGIGDRIRHFVRLLRDVLEVDRVSLYSLRGGDEIESRTPCAVAGPTVQPGVERTWRDQERTLVSDVPVERTARLNSAQLREAGVTSLISTAALTPVLWQDAPVAVLVASHRRNWIPEKDRLQLLSTCAEQISELLQSAELRNSGSSPPASDAAGESARLREEFLAKMSHELRTPVSGILGVADLALGTDLSTEQREYLTMVKSSSSSLMQLLNDVLDLSKIEAGGMQVEQIEFPLRRTVIETARTLAIAAHQKGLDVCVDIPAAVPDGLIGDPLRLRQIVTNLIGNAIKYTSEGEIVVAIRAEFATEEECALRFEIRDTGPGVPPAARERIFEKYEQTDVSDSRKFGGTGLGLPICRELVELMGGEIGVDSGPGGGSVFYFTARFGRCEGAAHLVPEDLARTVVLIADDHARSRDVLAEWLTPHVAGVHVSSTAKEALDQLPSLSSRQSHRAVILLDDAMQGAKDIVRAARRRKTRPTIVALRSLGRTADEAAVIKSPDAMLLKPIDPAELYHAVATPARDVTEPSTKDDDMSDTQPKSRPFRVLLAEDEKVNRLLAVRMLQAAGHEVSVVENGRQAVEAVSLQNFDLILMDLNMPEMDGVEATREIRGREKNGQHTPIVCLTASTFDHDRQRCEEAGMDGFCTKPLTAEAVRNCVAEIFGRPIDTEATGALSHVLDEVRTRS